MAYVADDMSSNGYPKPTFIVQADNIEVFGEINIGLTEYLKTTLGLMDDVQKDDSEAEIEKAELPESFLKLVKLKSDEEYCDQKEGLTNIALIKNGFQTDQWPQQIIEVFDVNLTELENYIPNEAEIGRWLIKNKAERYFVIPKYDSQKIYEQEYVEVPKKPVSKNTSNVIGPTSLTRWLIGFDGDKEYKLEKVEKTHDVLVGIEFTTPTPFKAIQVNFEPKFKSVEHYAFTLVPVFSHKRLEVFHSTEVLKYTGWDTVKYPECGDWKVKSLLLKDRDGLNAFCTEQVTALTSYIIHDVETKLKG